MNGKEQQNVVASLHLMNQTRSPNVSQISLSIGSTGTEWWIEINHCSEAFRSRQLMFVSTEHNAVRFHKLSLDGIHGTQHQQWDWLKGQSNWSNNKSVLLARFPVDRAVVIAGRQDWGWPLQWVNPARPECDASFPSFSLAPVPM